MYSQSTGEVHSNRVRPRYFENEPDFRPMHTKFERLLSKSLTTFEVMAYCLVVHTGPDYQVLDQHLVGPCQALGGGGGGGGKQGGTGMGGRGGGGGAELMLLQGCVNFNSFLTLSGKSR